MNKTLTTTTRTASRGGRTHSTWIRNGGIAGLLALWLCPALLPAAQVTLRWSAPTLNHDGSAVSALAGYRVYRGRASETYDSWQDVGTATNATLTGLADDTPHFFALTAYTSDGVESPFSAEIQWSSTPAVSALQAALAHYNPGTIFTVTNTLTYRGTLVSLRWRPTLPEGFTLVSVTGDGSPELHGGDILWPGPLPPSPIHMVYSVRPPLWAVAPQDITATVQCALDGVFSLTEAIPAPSLLTLTPADADTDGLPDSWEARYAAGTGGLEPGNDDDGDGASNIEESQAGTVPNDPASVLCLTRVTVEPDGRLAIRWQSVPTRRYVVCRAPALGAPFEPVASALPASSPENVWRQAPGGTAASFYRVQLEL